MRASRLVALLACSHCWVAWLSPSISRCEIRTRCCCGNCRRFTDLTDAQMSALRKIFARSGYMGQGNPAITRHPVTPEECQAKLKRLAISYDNPRFEKICGAKYMAPLYDPATQRPEDAKACIDQFEFPDIPCAYPVVWTKAREAAQVCEAVGKRLCDAHEWEGACDGALKPPDYRFDQLTGLSPVDAIHRMRALHNRADSAVQTVELWSELSDRGVRHVKSKDPRL